MNATPNIKLYAKFVAVGTQKTPKYRICQMAGYYPPMDAIRGRDGQISMYLTEKIKEGANVPSMRLQAKDSLNFTGLKEYFADGGKLSGYAYGYPLDTPTYSAKKKPNPFFDAKMDGFIFLFDGGTPSNPMPATFEMLVLEGAKNLIASYCKMLMAGGFSEALAAMRKIATPI